jgi:hypothetical protein
MGQVRRRPFIFATALSVLLCVATLAVTAWSFRVAEVWETGQRISKVESHHRTVCLSSGLIIWEMSKFAFAQYSDDAESTLAFTADQVPHRIITPPPKFSPESGFAGFGRSHDKVGVSTPGIQGAIFSDDQVSSVPLWFVATLFAILPLIWVRRYVVYKKCLRCLGRCKSCGYLLTGNTSGVCPECGMAVTKSN